MLARKLDDGALTNAEFARQTAHIDEKLDEIRLAVVNGMVEGSAQKTHRALTAREAEAEYQRIEEEFPVTTILRPEAYKEFLPAAREKLAAQGITLTPDANRSLPPDQQLALSRVLAPMAQEKYGAILKTGPDSGSTADAGTPGAAAAGAADQAGAGGETGTSGTGAAKKPALPPDIRETGETKLGVIEGGLSEKTVLEVIDNDAALDELIRKYPDEAERFAIGG